MSTAPNDTVTQLTPPAPKAAPLPVTVDVNNPTSLYLDTAVFAQINRVAVMMSKAGLAPKHLQGDDKIADCILVVAQALRWKSDPFAVAQHTFVTQGKLGYEGKLIAAMVNSSGKLKENLDYEYSGDGDYRKVVVTGTLKGSDRVRSIDGTVAKWKTDNKFWKSAPDQMLAYRGAREWARRHMPEVLLGVNSEEEISPRTMVDVTPTNRAAALNQALANAAPPADDLRTVEGTVEVVEVPQGETCVIDTDTGEVITTGTSTDRAAHVALRDKLRDTMMGMEDEANLDAFIGSIDDQLESLPSDLAQSFNDAVEMRRTKIKKSVRK